MSTDMPHSKLVQPAVKALNTMAASMNDSSVDSVAAADAFIAELSRLKEIAVDGYRQGSV
jgi:hypothetical protein